MTITIMINSTTRKAICLQTNDSLLGDIRICLTKDFKPMDCPKNNRSKRSPTTYLRNCPEDNISYIPMAANKLKTTVILTTVIILEIIYSYLWSL